MEYGLVKYEIEDGEVVFDIDKDKETIWASVEQIAELFGVQRAAIVKHINNILKDGELEEKSICSILEHMVNGRKYQKKLYNLDAIISVGYRVNSKKATKFRVWATSVLKRYVVDGVAMNERRLKELPERKLAELEGTLAMVKRLMSKQVLGAGEAEGILEVIAQYGKTTETITGYDEGDIPVLFAKSGKIRRTLSLAEVKNLAENLREQIDEKEEFGELKDEAKMEDFLNELLLDDSGKTVSEKAARLLYYVVKGEPFKAGNAQIGALVFIYFLTVNDCHLSENGETKLSDRALTALVLLIAESGKTEKELIINLTAKLIE
ncbi:virulence protein RhuM/Fic/DOC family protein [Candidatus Saccharibacteria bacterium]|nr:virulence protein RhuM/Fic/DOC family protein [Candidatus Saccharibacteria bacterium]